MTAPNLRALLAAALAIAAGAALAVAPAPFSFAQRDNVATQTVITSEALTLSGFADTLPVSIAGGNAPQYRIGSGAFTNSPGSVTAGQTLTVRHISAATAATASSSTVTVGTGTAVFTSTTGTQDRTPDAFSFGNQGNVAPGAVVASPAVVLTGFNTAVAVLPGTNMEYRINGGTWVSSSGSLQPGQSLALRHTASTQKLAYTRSTVTVGGVQGSFTTRTQGSIAPVAVEDRYSLLQDKTLTVAAPGVLANDTSTRPLTAVVVGNPANGVVTLNANGGFSYTPAAGFSGIDRFSYQSRDGSLASAAATVTLNVAFVPPPPVPVRLTLKQFGSGTPGRTFTVAPASACTVVTANAAYDCDQNVALTITAAAPPAGTYFAGWFDAPECANAGLDGGSTAAQPYKRDCVLTLTGARTLTAAFATTPTAAATAEADAATCDVTVSQHCFFPFPNNVFTRAAGATDNGSRTGLQINLVTAGRFPNPSSTGTPASGKTLDATEWNRNDGFSLNPKLITYIDTDPGTANKGADEDDLDATGVPHLADLSRSLAADTPVLLINATPKIDASGNPCSTGATCVANPEYLQKELLWAEPELPKRELRDTDNNGMMDTRVIPDAERALTIRVGRNLKYRQRYIAALRRFKRADGSYIEAEPNFRLYRDNQAIGATFPTLTARRAAMENIFGILGQAGVARAQLNQAWDFTVVSQENLHERLLHMRDTANTSLGASGVPCYTVEQFPNLSDAGAPVFGGVSPPYTASTCAAGTLPAAVPGNSGVTEETGGEIARTVSGTVAVPCFMTNNCAQGGRINYTPATAVGQSPQFGDNKPDQLPGAIFKANWQCRIPRSATGSNPARISLYGHGLLGGLGEVRSGHVARMANENNIVFCAMNWTGFATEDAAAAASTAADVSAFAPFIERQMQGHLAWIQFQELIVRTGGFMNHPAFRTTTGCPGGAASCPLYKLDFDADGNGGMFYDGNSQGGIMAGAVVALSKRITHAVLGVPGMNYSILLRRSSDFQIQNGEGPGIGATGFNFALQQNYPNDLDLAFIYSLSTIVWERTENAGFASNMTDKPLPNTPKHAFLLHPGYGDHQVSQWTNDILARSAGMSVIRGMTPASRFATDYPRSGTKYGVHKPFFGIPEITSFPFTGSALVYWDSGPDFVDAPPLYNAPPRTKQDPHEHVRRAPGARAQKSAFMRSDVSGGAVINSCVPGTLEGVCSSANHD